MKQTEIGLIPDDWEVKNFKEVTNRITVGIANSATHAYTDHGIIMFRNQNIKENTLDLKDLIYIKKDFAQRYLNKQLYENDLLIARTGYPGTTCVVPKEFEGCQTFTTLIATPKSGVINSNYIAYYFNSDFGKKLFSAAQIGGAQKNVNAYTLSNILICIPPLPEQHRIAKALSDVDALISTIEKLIQKKKNIKQGAMQNLLTGKKRLPGFAKSNKTKMTEIGEIPEDWEVKSLGEIFEFKPNNTFTRDLMNESKGEYQNVHYGDVLIKYSSILDCDKETIPFVNQGVNIKFSKYGIKEGDIIIADTAEDETVGKVVEIFNLGNRKLVSGLHTFLCRKITDDFAPRWLGYFMNQAIFHNQLLPFITGTKVSAISRSAIQNVKVLIPSKEEQTAIANVLSSMDKEIETLNTKLEKYRNIKTAMMQQLLTGKIRLFASETAEAISDKKQRAPNPFFKRSVLAAEIVDRLHDEPTFGHVKLQKLIFLTEKMCGIDIDSSYHRDAAGPYDNYGLRSIDSQLEKQKWFSVEHTENAYRYTPLENRGGHKQYFERYYADKKETFDLIIKIFQTAKTEQCEIVATLYSAWEDFLKKGIAPTDDQIITEVLTNWHESKTRIEKSRWISALSWMKENGFVPQG